MDPRPRTFVLVSGPPASGKTTLAGPLAEQLRLPLISKDTIKEAIMATFGVTDLESSRQAGRAAMAAMYALAKDSPNGAVLDAAFHRTAALSDLGELDGYLIEIFCRCDGSVASARYEARASLRHPGHLDAQRGQDDLCRGDVTCPVAGGWPVLEVDTNAPVDVTMVLQFIKSLAPLA